jgi:hypothetical protein
MPKFVEVKQEGKDGLIPIQINPDLIALVAPTNLIGRSQVVLTHGLSLTIEGTPNEVVARLEGRSIIELT